MMSPEERLDFLQEVPIFAGLKPAALRELAEQIPEVAVPPGGLIVREGAPGRELFIIHTGSVEVIKHLGESQETTLATLHAKDTFGEMAVIESVARSASVRAVKRASLFCVNAGLLQSFFESRPDQYAIVILNISRDLSRRLRALDENWSEASRKSSLDEAMIRAMEA
jgi:CRP/FNR family transcriptional regulator, cyclic AMP receptor protein